MNDNVNEYRNARHVVYNINVHLVFVTKYRKGAINLAVRTTIEKTAREVCSRFDTRLIAIDGEDDHIHLLVSYPPKYAISTLVQALKTNTSKAVRENHYEYVSKFLWGNHFWSPSYFAVSTGGAPLEKVRKYIENQRSPNRKPGKPPKK